MELSDLISPEAVFGNLKATSKKRVLQELGSFAANFYGLAESAVFAALLEREQLGPTGMGQGVAIPHARLEGLTKVVGVFAKLAKPVDYESVDGQPVDLVFMLLAPEDAGADHLKALARVSRVMRAETVRDKLRSTEDASALYAILTEPAASQAA
ncbi:PTS IIA-like nitrogen regulatory protein PtsN [Paroceanicella profunda]|uniref:PTS IIA-like nitrogen regulatory protein PtsN n=1 Tax=Paroceanicella profunda TaxID=2579971 RepID=A0A5B8FWM1_9RHOB|nr:PTS IIA-like nitrogen regulatory protein PtsN [Paroceanicella profunda]QDL90802.1 PTS IIA-like nitrogen regulatory protein PtsN [Paroceanicella profunda]